MLAGGTDELLNLLQVVGGEEIVAVDGFGLEISALAIDVHAREVGEAGILNEG